MANLKRNMIELIKNPEEVNNGAEPEIEKIWTPPFISLDVVYEAMDLMSKTEDEEADISEREAFDMMLDFVANKIYKDKITEEDLRTRLHAPDAIETLQDQVLFIAQGQQTDETKKFLEQKK